MSTRRLGVGGVVVPHVVRITRRDSEGAEYVERSYIVRGPVAIVLPHRWEKDPSTRVVARGGRVYPHRGGRVAIGTWDPVYPL